MRISYQLEALESARKYAEMALSEWKKAKLLARIPDPDAHSEHMDRFLAELQKETDEANTSLTTMQFRFATEPVLRATFYDPKRRAESSDSYVIHGPDRDLDEPHIYEETWECIRRYLQGDECMVDEDFEVFVITRKRPHRVIHVIRSGRKDYSQTINL